MKRNGTRYGASPRSPQFVSAGGWRLTSARHPGGIFLTISSIASLQVPCLAQLIVENTRRRRQALAISKKKFGRHAISARTMAWILWRGLQTSRRLRDSFPRRVPPTKVQNQDEACNSNNRPACNPPEVQCATQNCRSRRGQIT